MSNYHVEPAAKPAAITKEAIKALRHEQVQGLSRRQLLRTSLAAGIGVWLLEAAAGTVGFIWPNLAGGFGGKITLGKYSDLKTQNNTIPFDQGFPAYYADARAFVVLVDPAKQEFVPGEDKTGDGTALNVRVMYQRCPHLGCKPNPCQRNFWMECPCHGSRYDRLGVKAAGAQYGPAPRGMDRFAVSVDSAGVLTVDTGKITLGPLPIAVGQPGIIPPKDPVGCI
jgi:cytochrome b6-f complex iron-sulfur subunit